jgi:hypothetical protein
MPGLDQRDWYTFNCPPTPGTFSTAHRWYILGARRGGRVLPCIVVESIELWVELALRRFEEAKHCDDPLSGYRSMVTLFVTYGNVIKGDYLCALSVSPYAIPANRLSEVKGETSMGWTEFYAVMRDGAEFRFGTTFFDEFFEMPAGYTAQDIVTIQPAVRGEHARQERVYREKAFFTCYVEGL